MMVFLSCATWSLFWLGIGFLLAFLLQRFVWKEEREVIAEDWNRWMRQLKVRR